MGALSNDIIIKGKSYDYLRATSSSAIVGTGYNFKLNDKLVIEYTFEAVPLAYCYPFGAYSYGNFGVGFGTTSTSSNCSIVSKYGFGNGNFTHVAGVRYKLEVDISNKTFNLYNADLETLLFNSTGYLMTDSEATLPIQLFRCNGVSYSSFAGLRIHYFKVYTNGTLTKDYEPTKVGDVSCFKEMIGGSTFSGSNVEAGGTRESELYHFQNESIFSASAETAVALVGQELSVDTFSAEIKDSFEGSHTIYLFEPSNYDGIEGYDGSLFGSYSVKESDIADIPYGTTLSWYNNEILKGVYFVSDIERKGENKYLINAFSAVGLLNKQYHKGGMYNGSSLSTVLADIIGSGIEYSVSSDVASRAVYGWLPYDTKRNNLYQVLFATNTNLIKTTQGAIIITKLVASSANTISDANIFNDGSVTYGAVASEVQVNEHAYQIIGDESEETLFDNSSGTTVTNRLIKFDNAPIIASTISVTGLTLHEYGVNYAIVSGQGKITGKPYTHTVNMITKSNSSAPEENIVSCKDATLITSLNSDSIVNRLYAYYTKAKKARVNIVLSNERCGNNYSFKDAFNESVSGFLEKMSVSVTSFARAECEFIEDFTPYTDSGYSHRVLLTGNGTWTVPTGISQIRVVMISGGQGGSSGLAGTGGTVGQQTVQTGGIKYDAGDGGNGGGAGTVGKGGRVHSETLSVTAGTSYSYSCGAGGSGGSQCSSTTTANSGSNGGDTTFGSYSTSGYPTSDTGFVDVFTGNVYALSPTNDAVAGGKGGDGGEKPDTPNYYDDDYYRGKDGTAVTFNGTQYAGGSGEQGYIGTGHYTDDSTYVGVDLLLPGGGGSGAIAGQSGSSGSYAHSNYGGSVYRGTYTYGTTNFWRQELNIVQDTWIYSQHVRVWRVDIPANGADGLTPAKRDSATEIGQGGLAGHGGSGGGGSGYSEAYYYEDETRIIQVVNPAPSASSGGYGGAGGNGAQGGIIIYY